MYIKGEIVEQNFGKAAMFFIMSAAQGNSNALDMLKSMYENEGGKQIIMQIGQTKELQDDYLKVLKMLDLE